MGSPAEEQVVPLGRNTGKGSREREGWKARVDLAGRGPGMSGLKTVWDFRGSLQVSDQRSSS